MDHFGRSTIRRQHAATSEADRGENSEPGEIAQPAKSMLDVRDERTFQGDDGQPGPAHKISDSPQGADHANEIRASGFKGGFDIDWRRSSATCNAVRYFNAFDRRDADARMIRPLLDGASPVEASGSSLSHALVAKPNCAFAAHADRRFHKSETSDLEFLRWRKSDKSDLW